MCNLTNQQNNEFLITKTVSFPKNSSLTLECFAIRGGLYELCLTLDTFTNGKLSEDSIKINTRGRFDYPPTQEQAQQWAATQIKKFVNGLIGVL